MHRVDAGTYIGEPGETVTLTTVLGSGGQVSVTVDGQDLGATRQFTLGAKADRRTLEIELGGPLGATCVVTIATVDGGSDGDFLMCQAHEPTPVHTYTFDATAKAAIATFAAAIGAATAPAPVGGNAKTARQGGKGKKINKEKKTTGKKARN